MRILLFCFVLSTSMRAQDAAFSLHIKEQSNTKSIVFDELAVEQKPVAKERKSNFVLQTRSGIAVPVTFYDRGSNTLLIAAQGLPASKKSMEVFAQMFCDYDVVLFDYRWCNKYEKFLAKSILMAQPVQKVLLDPIEELKTVVNYFTERKQYNTVVGLGECYSCFHLAKLQSDSIRDKGTGLFTHLILDSCWYSLRCFAERICYDPCLPINPQDGGAPKSIKWFTNSRLFKQAILNSIFALMQDVSTVPYIATVGIPILFIHGQNDLFVPRNHFNKIWDAADKENRAVLFTPYQHSDNLGNKKIYRHVVEQFVANESMQNFERMHEHS